MKNNLSMRNEELGIEDNEILQEMAGALGTEAPLQLPPQGGESDDSVRTEELGVSNEELEVGSETGGDDVTRAEKELSEMTRTLGAEALLEIIKANRNMIIDQLIAEAKAEQGKRPMSSGVSGAKAAASIFDIAGMA